jgi:hypothetical protein
MRQKRTHKRYRKRLSTEFGVDGQSFKGIATMLSEGGLFIRSQRPLREGTVLDIKIYASEEDYCMVKGVIRHARRDMTFREKNGMGVELIEKDAGYINLINELKEQNS